MFKKLSLFVLLGFITFGLPAQQIYAQTVKVSGIVTDMNGTPVSGALVVEKGTSNVTKTDGSGRYELNVPTKDLPTSVFIRLAGLGSSDVAVDGTTAAVEFSPSLGSQTKSINEVVISASKKSEKILNAPASVSVISEAKIQQNTALTVVDNLRKTAAVDIMPTGLVSNNVNVRGFNGIFSGSLMYLVDNRIASVPSLRVNAFQLVPTSNSDISSMEVVRGPASALYGPNAANGVLAIYTKSPIDMENRMEITVGLTSGIRAGDNDMTVTNSDGTTSKFTANNTLANLGILNPEMRIAGRISKNLGVKMSGNYFSGSDFAFFDGREPNGKTVRFGNQASGQAWASDGSAAQTFNRDFKIKKYAFDGRVDWRPTSGTEFVFSGGYSQNTNMELTGLGAAQASNWSSNFFQTRFKSGRFFAQYYINSTNSGNTYLIPQSSTQTTFTYLKETSNFQSAQWQYSSDLLNKKLGLIYGMDAYFTRPSGNVYGRFDKNANISQYGGYLQANYKFNKQWSATLASRLDYQDVIKEWMLSPRGAIVYKPKENHTFRATYNRAYTAPSALNFYLDINNGALSTGQNLRAFGNASGINYTYGSSNLPMITLPTGQMVDYNSYILGGGNLAGAKSALSAVLSKYVPASYIPSTVSLLFNNINPGVIVQDLATSTKIDPANIGNKESVKSTVTQTAEIGYKGLLIDKLSVGIDAYYTRINNFVSPLTSVTYNTTFDPTYFAQSSTQAQMLANVNSPYLPAADKAALLYILTGKTAPTNTEIVTGYSKLIAGMGTVAGGVINPTNTNTGRDILVTYLNLGTVDVAGADLNFNYAANKFLNIDGAFSFVNKDKIPLAGASNGYIGLNAPKYKSAMGVDYKLPIDHNSVTARFGWRWLDAFYANSAVYIGTVDAANLFDLGLSWKPSQSPNTILSLNVNNVLDNRHAFFPGTPAMGRIALFKVLHTFGTK